MNCLAILQRLPSLQLQGLRKFTRHKFVAIIAIIIILLLFSQLNAKHDDLEHFTSRLKADWSWPQIAKKRKEILAWKWKQDQERKFNLRLHCQFYWTILASQIQPSAKI